MILKMDHLRHYMFIMHINIIKYDILVISNSTYFLYINIVNIENLILLSSKFKVN